jgi:hypothetical protein
MVPVENEPTSGVAGGIFGKVSHDFGVSTGEPLFARRNRRFNVS